VTISEYQQWLLEQMRRVNVAHRHCEKRGLERMAALYSGQWEAYQDALNQAHTLPEG